MAARPKTRELRAAVAAVRREQAATERARVRERKQERPRQESAGPRRSGRRRARTPGLR